MVALVKPMLLRRFLTCQFKLLCFDLCLRLSEEKREGRGGKKGEKAWVQQPGDRRREKGERKKLMHEVRILDKARKRTSPLLLPNIDHSYLISCFLLFLGPSFALLSSVYAMTWRICVWEGE